MGPATPNGAVVPGSGLNAVGWGRRRLLGALAGVATAGVLLLIGLGYAVYVAVTSDITSATDTSSLPVASATSATSGTSGTSAPAGSAAAASTAEGPQAVSGAARRDAIASAPMLAVRPADSRGAAPAAVAGASITIPVATTAGPAGVPAGFPHTPHGALGQLAAIETTALAGMSIAAANQVYEGWALPGGVGAGGWEITRDVQAFLTAASGAGKDPTTATVVATPAGAQVKGVDGDDWTLACVLLTVRARITVDAAIGYGYCERMQWQERRWMIAPGPPPARAPSTWPGTAVAAQAGWRTWVGGEQE